MSKFVFDGEKYASEKEKLLRGQARIGEQQRLYVLVFVEDEAGQLYARLKSEAAERIGVDYERADVSVRDPINKIQEIINLANVRTDVTGVMVQKPMKRVWQQSFLGLDFGIDNNSFNLWWEQITGSIDPGKDVDCLTRYNLDRVYAGQSKLLPATAQACLEIISRGLASMQGISDWNLVTSTWLEGFLQKQSTRIGIVGKSELVGKPLAYRLKQMGAWVELLGSGDNLLQILPTCEVVVSATGKRGLITAEMIKPDAVVVDVGSPGADVDFSGVSAKAGFITPVPGGVGPVTVGCLMENLVFGASGQ